MKDLIKVNTVYNIITKNNELVNIVNGNNYKYT